METKIPADYEPVLYVGKSQLTLQTITLFTVQFQKRVAGCESPLGLPTQFDKSFQNDLTKNMVANNFTIGKLLDQ